MEECEILHVTPSYAQIKTVSGKEQTVSLRDIAPLPSPIPNLPEQPVSNEETPNNPSHYLPPLHTTPEPAPGQAQQPVICQDSMPHAVTSSDSGPRRSSRTRTEVDRLNYDTLGGS